MALTRKMLKAMGVEEDKIDQIIEAHTETTDSMKEQLEGAKSEAAKNAAAAKELEALKANPGDDFQAKYEAEHKAFEDFKAAKEQEAAKAAEQALFKEQLDALGISGKRAEQILKVTDTAAFKVKDGAYEDAEAVAQAIKDEWSEFIPKERQESHVPANPQQQIGAEDELKRMSEMSMDEYIKYRKS